jgi:hypothetical protein
MAEAQAAHLHRGWRHRTLGTLAPIPMRDVNALVPSTALAPAFPFGSLATMKRPTAFLPPAHL